MRGCIDEYIASTLVHKQGRLGRALELVDAGQGRGGGGGGGGGGGVLAAFNASRPTSASAASSRTRKTTAAASRGKTRPVSAKEALRRRAVEAAQREQTALVTAVRTAGEGMLGSREGQLQLRQLRAAALDAKDVLTTATMSDEVCLFAVPVPVAWMDGY